MPPRLLPPAALACLLALAPAAAQAPPQGWVIEPPRRNVAATVIRTPEPATFYGFTCLNRAWSFFFHHTAPEGGACADAQACEGGALARVEATLVIPGRPERAAMFDLFSNSYFKEGAVTHEEMAAILGAETLTIRLGATLRQAWGREELILPVEGLRETLDRDRARFGCGR